MDPRVETLAKGALRRLGVGPSAGPARPDASPLELNRLTLPQLARLAYLQADDPLVAEVLEAMRRGRPVTMDRPAVEAALGLADYPARVREQFARWFSRISGYGVALRGSATEARPERGIPPEPASTSEPAAPSPPRFEPAAAAEPASADRQVLSEILGGLSAEDHPCWIEPGKVCCGSGRCKTLGF